MAARLVDKIVTAPQTGAPMPEPRPRARPPNHAEHRRREPGQLPIAAQYPPNMSCW